LATSLSTALRQAGFAVERRPFKPHVTLVRKLRPGSASLPELPGYEWRCRRFDLVQSVLQPQGAAYRKLASWNLAA